MKIPIVEFEFSFSRSSGPGGQNVNKLNTKVTLKWNLTKSKSLNDAQKKRFIKQFPRVVSIDNTVKITSQRFRNQSRNIVDCTEKLYSMLEKIEKRPKKRIPTSPTKNSIEKRIKSKKSKSEIKKNRQKIQY